MIRKTAALAAICLLCSPTARAVDSASLEIGRGDDRTSLLRIAVQDRWRRHPQPTPGWRLAGYWELSVAAWDNPDESTADIGLTPVFRFERSTFYVEGAVGVHLVSTRISAHRVFSTALQFGDHLGAGVRLGARQQYDLGVAIQHLSNGGVRSPNPGINFVLLRLQYHVP